MSLGQVKNLTQITLELVTVCELKMNVGRRLTLFRKLIGKTCQRAEKGIESLIYKSFVIGYEQLLQAKRIIIFFALLSLPPTSLSTSCTTRRGLLGQSAIYLFHHLIHNYAYYKV